MTCTNRSNGRRCSAVLMAIAFASTGFRLFDAFIGGVNRRVLGQRTTLMTKVRAADHNVEDHQPLQTPEVNYFTNENIVECLTEGCSVEKLEELDGKLERDQGRILESINQLRAIQQATPSADLAEVIGWFRNYLDNSREIRQKLGADQGSGMDAKVAEDSSSVVAEEGAEASTDPNPALQMPEVNYFTNLAIAECLTEGCSVEVLNELEGRLSRDAMRIQESMDKLRTAQRSSQSADLAEALGWFKNYINNSRNIQEQLSTAKSIKGSNFAKAFAQQFVQKKQGPWGGKDHLTDHPAERASA